MRHALSAQPHQGAIKMVPEVQHMHILRSLRPQQKCRSPHQYVFHPPVQHYRGSTRQMLHPHPN